MYHEVTRVVKVRTLQIEKVKTKPGVMEVQCKGEEIEGNWSEDERRV